VRWVDRARLKIFNMLIDYENIGYEIVWTVKSWKYWELRYYRD
jgi:hypothetical protein